MTTPRKAFYNLNKLLVKHSRFSDEITQEINDALQTCEHHVTRVSDWSRKESIKILSQEQQHKMKCIEVFGKIPLTYRSISEGFLDWVIDNQFHSHGKNILFWQSEAQEFYNTLKRLPEPDELIKWSELTAHVKTLILIKQQAPQHLNYATNYLKQQRP